jgi:exodeoxyribonuclease-3
VKIATWNVNSIKMRVSRTRQSLLHHAPDIAPEHHDVRAPDKWEGRNLCSEPERERLRALLDWGLIDPVRLHETGPGPFTWWDCRKGAFHRGWGLRIDLALGTRRVADRCTGVLADRDERKPTFGEGKPSDNAPLVLTLD